MYQGILDKPLRLIRYFVIYIQNLQFKLLAYAAGL